MSESFREVFYRSFRETGREAAKIAHYFPIYEQYFERFREAPIALLEIGIHKGGSLAMWAECFPNARIFGVDINPDCKAFEDDRIKVFIGSQGDEGFLQWVAAETGPLDIIIDDGSHLSKQQILTLQTLFPHLVDGGVYFIEDLVTSYDKYQYHDPEGGLGKPNTCISYLKSLIDDIHYSAHEKGEQTIWARELMGMAFFESACVLEKGRRLPLEVVRSSQGRHR